MDPFLFSGSSRATQIFVCSEQLPFLMLHYTRQSFGELIEDEDAASTMGLNTFNYGNTAVELSNGGTKLERFLPKTQHIQKENFEF